VSWRGSLLGSVQDILDLVMRGKQTPGRSHSRSRQVGHRQTSPWVHQRSQSPGPSGGWVGRMGQGGGGK